MTSIAERHKYILECLNRNGFIKVNDIAKDLEVTPVIHSGRSKIFRREEYGVSECPA